MSPILRWSLRLAELSLALIGLGVSILIVYAWVEVLNNPGITLVDGYWIGRVPWTPAGIVMILVGSVAALVAAAVAIVVEGGWWRRILIVPAWFAAFLWWSVAMGLLPFDHSYHAPDPVTLAYSRPTIAALLLLLPAVVLAGVAITPRRRPPPSLHLTRVHPPGEPPSPWRDEES